MCCVCVRCEMVVPDVVCLLEFLQRRFLSSKQSEASRMSVLSCAHSSPRAGVSVWGDE